VNTTLSLFDPKRDWKLLNRIPVHSKARIEALKNLLNVYSAIWPSIKTELWLQSSNLSEYLTLENWSVDEGLLILCGINPIGSVVEYSDGSDYRAIGDAVKICDASFYCETFALGAPSPEELENFIKLSELSLQLLQSRPTDADGNVNYYLGGWTWHDQCEQDSLAEEHSLDLNKSIADHKTDLQAYNSLKDGEWLKLIWDIREIYSRRLSRVRKLWSSGNHLVKNHPEYYLDWARDRKVDVCWLEWAKESNLLESRVSRTKDFSSNSDGKEYLVDFQKLPSLRFKDIEMTVDPERYLMQVKARDVQHYVPFVDLGLTTRNAINLNQQGELFMAFARRDYDINAPGFDTSLGRLSKSLRQAFGTTDSPFSGKRPTFKISIPKDNIAKKRAEEKTVRFNDSKSYEVDEPGSEWLVKNDPDAIKDNPIYNSELDD